MKVLVATDDATFSVGLTNEYRHQGFDVQSGLANLFLTQQNFDLIHCHWPEEIAHWRVPPDPVLVGQIIACLDWWREQTKLVCSVHNLLPHRAAHDARASYEYYQEFMLRMHHIGHFSETSREEMIRMYPSVPAERHFVHGMNLFPEIGRLSLGRDAARRQFGFSSDRFVVGLFGQLRLSEEVELLQTGLDLARRVKPKVLFASRLPSNWGSRRSVLKRIAHRRWQRRNDVMDLSGYLSDEQTAAFFDAVDVVIVPRFGRHLNSGLMPLAMTFGTPLAAPDYGVYREYLAGSGNALYEPGDAKALALAIEHLATQPLEQLRKANQARSTDWGWPNIVKRIVATAGLALE